MKRFLICLVLGSSVASLAGGDALRFAFPPFAKEDMEVPDRALPERPSDEELEPIPVPVEELRRIMATADYSDQCKAAAELMKRGDQKTILRIVYSLKQGNVAAEEMLGDINSLAAIPYLMEEVAHGSLENYGAYHTGDISIGEGRVRVAAVKHVAETLFRSTEFTGEAMACLKSICRGDPHRIQGLSDESRYLVQWWLLNKDAFEVGKWEDIRPLPQKITYIDPKDDILFPFGEPRARRPPLGSPEWELAEPFEAWAERIVDLKRQNLDFVALSWDGKKVIEHPAKSLDPKAKPVTPQDRESRKTPTPRSPSEPESGDGVVGRKGIWISVAAILMVFLSIVRWMRRKPAAG